MNQAVVASDLKAADALSAIQAVAPEIASLGRMVGQFEAVHFYQTVGDAIKLAAFESAKQSKAYRFLINPKTQNPYGNLDEFCESSLGVGYERMRQIAANRNVLGQQTFEQAERLGLHQIDYNAIRALPAPAQEIVKAAIADGSSRDDVVIALQRVAAIAAEQFKKTGELEADAEATGKLLEAKNKKLDQLTRSRKKNLDPWPDEVAGLKDDIHTLAKVIDEALSKHLTLIDATDISMQPLDPESDAFNGYKTVVHHLGEAVERICTLAASLRAEYDATLAGHIALDKTNTLDG